jgi:uncharacterized protein YcbX
VQYPLHLLNLASLRDFETKVKKDDDLRELDPRRFRANIIGELTNFVKEKLGNGNRCRGWFLKSSCQ